MNKCAACEETKPEEEFNWKNKSAGLRSKRCKACTRKESAAHYQKNKSVYNARARKNAPRYYAKSRQYIIEYLKSHPCVDCGNSDIRVLQFDHKEMVGTRGKRVSDLKSSYGKLLEEIAKCDVRCANCHMIRTFEQMGWDRLDR